MSIVCKHKGCGKKFDDGSDEPCVYHPGPPIFHEGQKGWKCCKPRFLTFDEFLTIPPCTTGKHSAVDDTPVESPKPAPQDVPVPSSEPPAPRVPNPPSAVPKPAVPKAAESPAPPPESESDDPSLSVKDGSTCRRKGCNEVYKGTGSREGETCVHHPGAPVFHEGSKGWSCCKRRVLEFDEFMKIEGCKTKKRHLFIGKAKREEIEKLDTVRTDFYQTTSTVIASVFLKKIDKDQSTVKFTTSSVDLDLKTSDKKHYDAELPLYGQIDPEKSTFKILGTKLELNLAKTDGLGWPVLRATDPLTGEIIQSGRAGRV